MSLLQEILMIKVYVYDGGDNPILITNTDIDKDEFEEILEDLPEFIKIDDSRTGISFCIPVHRYLIGWQEE